MKMLELSKKDERRFWSYVKKSASCWFWIGSLEGEGYGTFSLKGKRYMAHRISYQIHLGEIPDNQVVAHKCHNRACINPRHLTLRTHRENIIDTFKRSMKGEKLTHQDVLEIHRRLSVDGEPSHVIAQDYPVSRQMVYKIKTGKSWGWLTGVHCENK